MRFAYYNSCSLRSTGKEYDKSIRAVFNRLDVKLIEPENWVCCGSTIAHNVSHLLSIALPMKNLAEIEKEGFAEVIVPCTACYSRFKIAQHDMKNRPGLKEQVEEVIEYKFKGEIKVLHPLEVLAREDMLKLLAEKVEKDLSGLKVVSYYGCLLVRPPKIIGFDDVCEYPETMDKILKAVGINTLDWSHKTECCGGSLAVSRPDIVKSLSKRILDDAKEVGAEAISVPCTFCHLNMDTRQEELAQEYSVNYDMPIVYFTELVALALGEPANKLWLNKHIVDTGSILQKVAAK